MLCAAGPALTTDEGQELSTSKYARELGENSIKQVSELREVSQT